MNNYFPHCLIGHKNWYANHASSSYAAAVQFFDSLHIKQRENKHVPAENRPFWPFTLDDYDLWSR